MSRPVVAVVVGGLAVAMLIGMWFGGRPAEPVAVAVERASPADDGGRSDPVPSLTVYVSGAVVAPGLVSLPEGSRVADAVAAVGGVTVDAELSVLNLAASVVDGQQILVSRRGDPPPTGSLQDPSGGAVAVNRASVDELATLPGIGPVLAERIAAHRDQYGPFATIEDLLDVSGIGETKLAGLRDAVVVP